MLEYQVIFDTSFEPDLQFIGTVKQYSDNQYKLKVDLPSGYDTGYTISANIKRADDEIGSYVLTWNTDHWELDFVAWATAISGELQVTIQAVDVSENIFVFKTILFNIEESVATSDYDPPTDSPEYTSIMAALATKQNADADLTSIAGLTATSGVLKKVGANNWALSNNYFELVDGLIPAEYLPTYVDDVIEGVLVNSTTFTVGGNAVTPESGKIYVSTANEKVYRWSGSLYVEISSQITVGNLTGQAFDGALGKRAFDNGALAAGWGNHANAGYLTSNSTTITDITNFANGTASNLANLTNSVGNLNNTVSDLGNLVTTINGSYLTANSSTITDLSNGINATNNNVANLSNVVANKADTSALNSTNSNLTNLANVVANKVDTSLLGAVNGVATLDSAGKVPSTQLPSYVDDVVEYADLGNFPVTGETGKIYVALDTDLTYRWSGTQYTEISKSLALGNTSTTAFRGDLGKEAYDWGNHANGGYALNTAIANAPNWDTAYGWGNHANAGYLTTESDTLNTVSTRGNTTNAITVNYVSSLQTTYNSAAEYGGVNAGQVGWSQAYGTLQVGLLNGAYAKVGQTELYYGKATEAITKGQVVMFNGSQGDFIKLSLANPSIINNNPDYMLGLATTNIANDTFGYVSKFGYIDNINTNGFANGTILWFDSNTSNASGGYTDVKPVAPNAKIQLAAVVKASSTPSSTNGRLLVRVATGSQLGGTDSNVELVNVANGEVLAYNGTSLRWENKEVVSLGLNVALTNIANDQYLAYSNGTWINRDLVVYGTVNSVGITTATTGLTVNGTVTNTGNLSVDVSSGYVIPTTTEQTNWNSAYSWGNHQAVGYIVGLANGTVADGNIAAWNGTTGKLLKDTGVAISSILTSETDPVFSASNAATILGTDITNWNTAYSWGNHANAGYLTSSVAANTYQAIGNYATLTNGKVSADVLPAIAITDTFVVASEAAMLALTAETGDVAIRTDVNKTFILSANPASTLANWKEVLTPADGVTSVALAVPTGLQVANSPITSTGTLNITYATGYEIPTTSAQTNWNTAYSWGNHANAGYGNVVGAGTVTSGNIVTYDGTTGKLLSTGLTLETTRTNSSTAVPTSHAVANYVTGLDYQTGSGTVAKANSVSETRASVQTYVWVGTNAQYQAIGTKNTATLYFVTA